MQTISVNNDLIPEQRQKDWKTKRIGLLANTGYTGNYSSDHPIEIPQMLLFFLNLVCYRPRATTAQVVPAFFYLQVY